MLKRQLSQSVSAYCASSPVLPPTFLLPLRAQLATASSITTTRTLDPNPLPNAYISRPPSAPPSSPIPPSETSLDPANKPRPPRRYPQISKHTPSFKLSPTVTPENAASQALLLRALVAQNPHYVTVHIHARPYLVTQGDVLRLPFLMPDVVPGTTIRLNRASMLGSRDFTLRGGGSGVVAAVQNLQAIAQQAGQEGTAEENGTLWIDERLFVCRAVVTGVESEPMRFTEKTKRRRRHVQTIKSKGRFTILRIVECTAVLPEDGDKSGK